MDSYDQKDGRGGSRRPDSWMDETYRAGRDVDGYVDDAIRSGDYSSLNEKINQAMNRAADSMHDALIGEDFRTGKAYRSSGSGRAVPYRREQKSGISYGKSRGQEESYAVGSGLVRVRADGPANVEKWIGKVGFYFNLILAILMVVPTAEVGGWIFFAVLAAVFYRIRKAGDRKLNATKKARRIIGIANGRDILPAEEIASAFGTTVTETKKELREMIRKGVLSGTVYLDRGAETLMLSREAYDRYKDQARALRLRQEKDRREASGSSGGRSLWRDAERQAESMRSGAGRDVGTVSPAEPGRTQGEQAGSSHEHSGTSGAGGTASGDHPLKEYEKMQEMAEARGEHERKLNAETREILEEGHAFIAHIHRKNDEIPGEEISAKLDRLEKIVTGIFDQVEQNPESAPDLHRLMSYYLPTTQKLIDTYASLDAQHVAGNNIDRAKREIENSLDTINSAYEKLLDSFFQSTLWDVGTDVSVMKSMLQQDGLADDDLQKMRAGKDGPQSGNTRGSQAGQGVTVPSGRRTDQDGPKAERSSQQAQQEKSGTEQQTMTGGTGSV